MKVRLPAEGRAGGTSLLLHAGAHSPVGPEQLWGEAGQAGLGQVGQLLGQWEGHPALEERPWVAPLAQSGLLGQGLKSYRVWMRRGSDVSRKKVWYVLPRISIRIFRVEG